MPKKNTKDGSKASADEFMKYHNAVFSLVKCLPQNFTEALHLITETSSKMLEVKRVGVWFFDDKRSFITCLDQFTAGDNSQHTFGSILNAKKYPIYFRSLGENRIIATSTAKDDPRTSEFADSYLTPFGITSMLDIPIWKGNSVIGVVCCEHIGKPRLWSEKEKVFAAFISDIISMSFSADMCSIAEERLLNEKRWRENIIDLAPNIIVGLEQKSNIVIFNRCAEELTGYKAEEVRGKPWIEIFIPEKGREELYKVWDNLVMEDDTFQEVHENEIVTKEGTKRLIRWHNRSLSGKSGKPLVLSIGEDITEQREIFESLKQSESKYKNVMESANEAIMLVDVSQKLIKETNAASENLLGIKTSEIVGKKFGDFMSQKNLMMITYPAKKNGSQSHGTSWIDEAIANDGRKIPVQITGSIIKTEGLEYYLLIIRNITSFIDTKKILEDDKSKLEKTVELKNDALKNTLRQVEASRRLTDIGALSATVAHEIRNPLSVIRAAVYNIRRKISEPGIEKHLDNIEKKILQTDKIITNLGSYAKINLPTYERVDIKKVINESIETMLAKHSGAKIEFQKIFEKSRDWNIEADRLQMMELMMNLLDNAVIAMKDKGGRLTVSLSKSSDDQDIYIVITDEGSGISAEVLPNIFNPFYSTRHNGIGLGLTICQQLVYLHQGTIEINSRKDEGTTVKLTLPAKHPQ